MLGLEELLKRTVGRLSGGQRRKLDIARALINSPRLLILDEPTTGLDPQTRKTLWAAVSELQRSNGATVLLTTHYMEEAADADHVLIIDGGKRAAEGTPLELKNAYSGDRLLLYGITESEAALLGTKYERTRDGYSVTVPDTHFVTELILRHPDIFRDYEIIKGKMDDVFLAATGKRLSGGNDK